MTEKTYEKLYREVDCARLLYQNRLRELSAQLGRISAGEPGAPSLNELQASIEGTLFHCMTLYGDTLTATESGERPVSLEANRPLIVRGRVFPDDHNPGLAQGECASEEIEYAQLW